VVCAPPQRARPGAPSDALLAAWSQAPKAKAKVAAKATLGVHNAKDKSIEETYQKLSPLEHILLRPDTYIGSIEPQQQQLWVHDGEGMKLKNITFAPGLFKIFDEILVNAADNKVRDSSMDTLRVDVDVVSLGLLLPRAARGQGRPACVVGHVMSAAAGCVLLS
jgi:DNA topoisomerase-2